MKGEYEKIFVGYNNNGYFDTGIDSGSAATIGGTLTAAPVPVVSS